MTKQIHQKNRNASADAKLILPPDLWHLTNPDASESERMILLAALHGSGAPRRLIRELTGYTSQQLVIEMIIVKWIVGLNREGLSVENIADEIVEVDGSRIFAVEHLQSVIDGYQAARQGYLQTKSIGEE